LNKSKHTMTKILILIINEDW